MAGGRPTDYTEEIAANICASIAEGKSLVSICKQDGMPSTVTVYSWLQKNEEFLNIYTRAREDQADTLADEIIDIADDATHDTTVNPETGYECANTEWLARSRLRVEARKWVASKLKPKKYSDKLNLEGNIDHNLTVEITRFSE
jgi:hypothetical protein